MCTPGVCWPFDCGVLEVSAIVVAEITQLWIYNMVVMLIWAHKRERFLFCALGDH